MYHVTIKYMTYGSHLGQMLKDGRILELACAAITLFVASVVALRLACLRFDGNREDPSIDTAITPGVDLLAFVIAGRGIAYLLGAVAIPVVVYIVVGGSKSPEISSFASSLSHLVGIVAWVFVPSRLLSLNIRSAITVCLIEALTVGAFAAFIFVAYCLFRSVGAVLPGA